MVRKVDEKSSAGMGVTPEIASGHQISRWDARHFPDLEMKAKRSFGRVFALEIVQ
jgi:hypothetical protein